MKKYLHILLTTLLTVSLFAQSDSGAKKILDEVAKKYDDYKTVQATFSFVVKNAEGKSYADQGTLFLNKSKNQYQIKLNEQQLISDGTAVWTIMQEEKEIQITEAESTGEAIGPQNLFTFYKTGYKYVGVTDDKVGNAKLTVIELSPLDTKKSHFKIRIRINKNKHIHDVTIFDKSGSNYTYKINELFVNHRIDKSIFTFNKSKYPNFEVIDLR